MIQQKQIDYAKEVDDVMVALVGLVSDIKAHASAGTIATDAFQNVIAAVSGLSQLSVEIAANKKVCMETVGYRVGDLASALLG